MKRSIHRHLLLCAALLVTACSGLEIVRAPFVSPVVIPAPDIFLMNVAVKNFSDTASEPIWLKVYSEYSRVAGQQPCRQEEVLSVGQLQPEQSWARADYRIDRASSCPCVKGECAGHVWLSLHRDPLGRERYSGANTGLHVNWATSGNLADLTISEF